MDATQFMEAYLSHAYDPVKAKEYYERTKKLKGRKKGVTPEPAGGRPTAGNFSKTPPKAVAKKAPSGNRMAMLNERLNRLNEVLDLLASKVAAAQARSGVEGVAKKTAATKKAASSTTEPSKDKTSTQKKADAKAAAKAYEKNQKGESTQSAQAVQDEIEEVQKKIAEARDELVAALAKARASSPKPKTANTGRPVAGFKQQKEDRQNGA